MRNEYPNIWGEENTQLVVIIHSEVQWWQKNTCNGASDLTVTASPFTCISIHNSTLPWEIWFHSGEAEEVENVGVNSIVSHPLKTLFFFWLLNSYTHVCTQNSVWKIKLKMKIIQVLFSFLHQYQLYLLTFSRKNILKKLWKWKQEYFLHLKISLIYVSTKIVFIFFLTYQNSAFRSH